MLLQHIAGEAGADPALPGLPVGVQAVIRRDANNAYLFLLNHNTSAVTVPLPAPAPDLLTDPDHAVPEVNLPPRGVAVLKTQP